MFQLDPNTYQASYILGSFSKKEVYWAIDTVIVYMVSLEKSVEGFLRYEEAIYNLYQTVTNLTVSTYNSDAVERVVDLLLAHEDKVRQMRQMVQHGLRNYKMEKMKDQFMEKTPSMVISRNQNIVPTKNIIE